MVLLFYFKDITGFAFFIFNQKRIYQGNIKLI